MIGRENLAGTLRHHATMKNHFMIVVYWGIFWEKAPWVLSSSIQNLYCCSAQDGGQWELASLSAAHVQVRISRDGNYLKPGWCCLNEGSQEWEYWASFILNPVVFSDICFSRTFIGLASMYGICHINVLIHKFTQTLWNFSFNFFPHEEVKPALKSAYSSTQLNAKPIV